MKFDYVKYTKVVFRKTPEDVFALLITVPGDAQGDSFLVASLCGDSLCFTTGAMAEIKPRTEPTGNPSEINLLWSKLTQFGYQLREARREQIEDIEFRKEVALDRLESQGQYT